MTCNKCGAVLPVNAVRCAELECRTSTLDRPELSSSEPDGYAEYLEDNE